MAEANIAKELASGGAYTAWFIVVFLAGVVGFLFRQIQVLTERLITAYKEDDSKVLENQDTILSMLREHTSVLSTILGILTRPKR